MYSSQFLIENNLQGKFPDEVILRLKQNPLLLREVTIFILYQNFPETIHQDILDAVGLDLSIESNQPPQKNKKRVGPQNALLQIRKRSAD